MIGFNQISGGRPDRVEIGSRAEDRDVHSCSPFPNMSYGHSRYLSRALREWSVYGTPFTIREGLWQI